MLFIRPYWLRLGYWKRRLSMPTVLRPFYAHSLKMSSLWQAQFKTEVDGFFRGCKFHPTYSNFAAVNAPLWKGIFQNRVAPSRILELGSWQGSSAVAFAALFPNAHITCVDNWQGSHILDKRVNPEELFNHNTARFIERLHKIESGTFSALLSLHSQGGKFDLIYIDGSHLEDDVMVDSVLSWRLLNIGGMMIWDDYRWHYKPFGDHAPKAAIDFFLLRHQGQYRVLFVGEQVAVQKTAEGDAF